MTLRVLTVPFRMYGFAAGTLLKTDSLTPKFLARILLGVCATQSSILKVVLMHISLNFACRA